MKTNINWKAQFYQAVLNTPLQAALPSILPILEDWQADKTHSDANKWKQQLSRLPQPNETSLSISNTVSINTFPPLSEGEQKAVANILKQYMPWRKGPFELFGVYIDTEWRSDFKWNRILPHIETLKSKRVLDVGCGSGYHLFRMHEQGPEQVIGIDPTTLFFYQFQIFKQYLPERNIHLLPLGIEQLPNTNAFDTVFSMGVFYHRADPMLFLKQLKQQLVSGGQLVLETLVVEGDENTVFMPEGRYAQMRNVYFLPSIPAMLKWLHKAGFNAPALIDDCVTTVDEQRSTEWMSNHSLNEYLDQDDNSKTIEGYSAPRRASFVAYR